ncbi:LacI family DNA-binding transcriptional regulator [Cohnella panacarvi]|uniref:LacI family DNA-binding transcriptional regulator n=1 Tax=Cohnella panacarvi TaxID=400776 RepID=UPI00047D4D68|nr:LacI family DNA-binding transcriptional regulator [Cohnella panacarvi]
MTIKDIAAFAKLSVTTVSKVINQHPDISTATKKRVLKAIDELGYVPNLMASNLRKKSANLVALLLSDMSKPYFANMINGFDKVLNESGYQTLIFSSNEDAEREQKLIRQISSIKIAGIIVDSAQNGEKNIELLDTIGVPYIRVNRISNSESGYYVAADNELAGYLATEHLLQVKPDAPVLCVNGPDDISPTIARYVGYRRALQEAGVNEDEQWVFNNHYGLTDAYRTGLYIADHYKPPFSVFCSTDLIALGLLRALSERGIKVPEEVSVIGVDDIDIAAYSTPALSTISLPKELIGEKSAEMLIALINNEEIEIPRCLLAPELIIREST